MNRANVRGPRSADLVADALGGIVGHQAAEYVAPRSGRGQPSEGRLGGWPRGRAADPSRRLAALRSRRRGRPGDPRRATGRGEQVPGGLRRVPGGRGGPRRRGPGLPVVRRRRRGAPSRRDPRAGGGDGAGLDRRGRSPGGGGRPPGARPRRAAAAGIRCRRSVTGSRRPTSPCASTRGTSRPRCKTPRSPSPTAARPPRRGGRRRARCSRRGRPAERKLYWPTYLTVLHLAGCGAVTDLLALTFETRDPTADEEATLPRSVMEER